MKLLALLNNKIKDTGIKYPFLFLCLIAIIALGIATYYYFTGEDTVMPWLTVPELQTINISADEFQLLLQDFKIQVKGFLLSERFDVGLAQVNTTAASVMIGLLAISFVYYLAFISTLRQIPFFIGVLLWMLLLTTFNFDLLGIFRGQNQYILLGIFILTGGSAFLFQAFLTRITFGKRVFIFGLLLALIGAFIFQASPLLPAQTALHLINYSSSGGMVATALFIFWVAYENIHGLLWFNTQSQYPERRFSLWQFVLISGLYLLNLTLLYLQNTNLLDLDITLINAFLILVISALVGYWGTKQREFLYQRVFSFQKGAAYLYLVLAIICFATIGYAFATANDPVIRAFRDLIVYTHLAFGAIFLVYLLLNFGTLIRQKLRVYRVVYDPKIIPYYTVYILGVILFASLMLRGNNSLHRQATAGYYNYLGDFYSQTNDNLLAERFYLEGNVYENYNVKSNYALASLYHEKAFMQSEINLLKNALRVYPSDKIYARLANKYTDRTNFFDQMFLLREGVKLKPQSAPLLNNQALLYGSIALADSAGYFFNLAQQHATNSEIVRSNRLAFYLGTGLGKPAADLAKEIEKPTYLPLQSNYTVWQQLRKSKVKKELPTLPQNLVLTLQNFALVYHTIMQGSTTSDKENLNLLNKYLAADANINYRFDLSVLKALVQNRLNQTLAARTTLENLVATEPDYAGYILDMIGLQLLNQKLYAAAAEHFAQAQAKGWPEAGLHRLYALAFQPDRTVDALLAAEALKSAQNPAVIREAAHLQNLLQANPEQIITAARDSTKVQYLQLNQQPNSRFDATDFSAIVSTVQNPELKKQAQKELAAFYVAQGNITAATQILQTLLPQLDQKNQLLSEVNILQAEILLRQNNLNQLSQALTRMYLSGFDQKLKLYYQAQLAQKQNQTQEAQKYYQLAVQAIPFHEPTVLAAANFYSDKLKNHDQAYELLLNSITYNRYSPPIFKAYILKSVEVGYTGFAETALTELATLISPAALAAFQEQYQQQLARRQSSLQLVQ